jgi:glycosyltransferase involved in cell wall biosynthesis
MKIAILTPTFSQFSGIDRVVEKEIEDLSRLGHSVTMFCFKAEMKAKYGKTIELGMPKNTTLERIYSLFFFLDFLKINKMVTRLGKFDRIICHQYPLTILASRAKKRFGTTYIYYNAGVAYPDLFQSFIEKNYMRLFTYFTNVTVKNADEAISISKFLSDTLKKEIGLSSKVEYVQIDKQRFRKGVPKGRVREKYNIGNAPLCVYVGRISPHKGVHILIKAFNLVLKEIPIAKLLIIGKKTFGKYAKELEELANKVNKKSIIFTGFVLDEELPYFYADANLYTTATLWEGFDMPIVEAAACGTPTVAFNIGAHPEVLKMGKLVKAGNIQEFSQEIIKYLRKGKIK